jgi:SIR2-like protein
LNGSLSSLVVRATRSDRTTWEAPSAMGDSEHYYRLGRSAGEVDVENLSPELRQQILAWLAAILQAEHLNVLLGSGFTTAVAGMVGNTAPGMTPAIFDLKDSDRVDQAAARSAKALGRKAMNLEDQLRSALQLLGGLEIDDPKRAKEWRKAIDGSLEGLAKGVLAAERGMRSPLADGGDDNSEARDILVRFLLAFAHRTATRERLHIFTTNYDRLVEHGCDLAGLRCLDRFVGALEPLFRASRLDVDLHYSPPGMRGEPRYLEGVLRLSKLHGSLDWRASSEGVRRVGLPFGAEDNHPWVVSDPIRDLLVYPNSAKDVETLEYPYAEIFRDAAAALCRPNTALLTYGYGFGDDHVNRIFADMLTIPSTHLVVISYDWADGRVEKFLADVGHQTQTTLLIGKHFGDLRTLTDTYLPSQSLERLTARQAEWREKHPDTSRPAVGSPPERGTASADE